jgi:viroplasmin and RNaseH domain-containing protein
MAKPKKFYVVWEGRQTGIFETWAECKAQVKGFAGAQFMSFETREEAERAFQGTYQEALQASKVPKQKLATATQWTLHIALSRVCLSIGVSITSQAKKFSAMAHTKTAPITLANS